MKIPFTKYEFTIERREVIGRRGKHGFTENYSQEEIWRRAGYSEREIFLKKLLKERR